MTGTLFISGPPRQVFSLRREHVTDAKAVNINGVFKGSFRRAACRLRKE